MACNDVLNQVGILFNTKVPDAEPLAGEVQRWLESMQLNTWSCPIGGDAGLPSHVEDTCLLVVLGGDGTTLHAARMAAPHDIPIFAVNLGRVGFLSESTPDEWQDKLKRVLQGQHWIEKRLMLRAEVCRNSGALGTMIALNEIVVSRGAQVKVVRFHLHVDGDHVTTYTADALVAATPTGSTAYSMAAGGPLLPPQLQNFLVLPVAPHLSFERPLVLHKEAVIMVRVEMEQAAIATADGQDAIELQNGDEVIISKYACESRFARVGRSSYFYNRLMQRLSYWSLKK